MYDDPAGNKVSDCFFPASGPQHNVILQKISRGFSNTACAMSLILL